MTYEHMGASTVKRVKKYPHKARCVYSGNTGIVYSVYEKITKPCQQDNLDSEFMKLYCNCARCVDARKHRKKVKKALEEINAEKSLKAMGW